MGINGVAYQLLKSPETGRFIVIHRGGATVGRVVVEQWAAEVNAALEVAERIDGSWFTWVESQLESNLQTQRALVAELLTVLGTALARGYLLGVSPEADEVIRKRWEALSGCKWAPPECIAGSPVICPKCQNPTAYETLPGVVSCRQCSTICYRDQPPAVEWAPEEGSNAR